MVAADKSEFPSNDRIPTALKRYLLAIETAALLRYVLAIDSAANPLAINIVIPAAQGGDA